MFASCTPLVLANQSLVPPAPWKKNTIGQSLVASVFTQDAGTSSSTSQVDVRPCAVEHMSVLRIWGDSFALDVSAWTLTLAYQGFRRIVRRR
mmetsp:Transcript_14767/g.22941  ORF Transcript_14767/g.22941 Transcript_14767/m.22941 type:complete len:92 (+) Transcript_14767:1377-1652(+)